MDKQKINSVLDKTVYCFFCLLFFFLPISNAAVESIFGFLFLFYGLKLGLADNRGVKFKEFFSNKPLLAALIFWLALGVSVLFSGKYFNKSLHTWFFGRGEDFLFFCFAYLAFSKRNVKLPLLILSVSGILVSVNGLWQAVFGKGFMRGFALMPVQNFTAMHSTFNNRNDFASFLVILSFLLLGFLLDKKTRNIFFGLGLVVALVCLSLTYSRGGWLGFLTAGVLAGMYFVPGRKKLAVLAAIFLFVCTVLVFPDLRQRFLCSFHNGGDSGRFDIWEAALRMFWKHPFVGIGTGTFMQYLGQYSNNTLQEMYAHNCYLQVLAEAGILGFLSFLWFLGEWLQRVFNYIKRKSKDYIFVGLSLGLCGFLVHAFFDTQMSSLRLSALFWVLAGLSIGYIDK